MLQSRAPVPGKLADMKRTIAALVATVAASAATVLGVAPATADTSTLTPGSWIMIRHSNSADLCTLGFITIERATRHAAALTAGHCGNVGDKVYSEDGSLEYGTVVRSVHPASDYDLSDDLALVRFDGVDAPRSVNNRVDGKPVLGFLTAAQANALRPVVCKDGARTGLSCGTADGSDPLARGSYVNSTVEGADGDSGSPLFVPATQGVWALGVLRGGGSGTLVASYASSWGLDFVSPNLPPAAAAATTSLTSAPG